MSKLISNVNDLATTHPELVAEWDNELNGDLKPTDFTAGSGKKVWWKCKEGHSWETAIMHRTNNHGCPYCTNRKVLVGFNDLATVKPSIVKEWDKKKNGNLKPTNVLAGSTEKVWWKCKKGHSYLASIRHRVEGQGCGYCSHKRTTTGVNDLATKNPKLAEEWDYEKNGNLKPTDVTLMSARKVWWKCKKGHSYEAVINNRSRGRGCPYCAGKKILEGYNDLSITHPELAKEWDYNKNTTSPTDFSKGSHKKVWWLCKKGHSWEATINSRSKGIGCPYCAGLKALAGFNDLSTTHPQLAKEWDREKNGKLTPENCSYGSSKKVWWNCSSCNHNWEATIISRSKGAGCPKCSKTDSNK